uniref:Uncharacterized protein n=1 Tax=Anguilla anguilla TaxID=7936 RepID=A0A0E9USG7_ANGAN
MLFSKTLNLQVFKKV